MQQAPAGQQPAGQPTQPAQPAQPAPAPAPLAALPIAPLATAPPPALGTVPPGMLMPGAQLLQMQPQLLAQQQQLAAAMMAQQQAAAAPRPSVGGAPAQPPANFTIQFQDAAGVRQAVIPQAFLAAHPTEWPAWVSDPSRQQEMLMKMHLWIQKNAAAAMLAQQRAAAAAAAAAPRRADSAGGALHGAPAPAPALTPAQASAAAQSTLQARLAAQAAARASAPIIKPQTNEEKQFLPRQRLRELAREVGGPNARLAPDAEAALKALAAEFAGGAVSFAAAMARKRKGAALEPADISLYLERAWHIEVPGYSNGEIRPYQRPAQSELHRARLAAVRRATLGAPAAAEGQPAGAAGTQPPAEGGAAAAAKSPEPAAAAAAKPAGGKGAAQPGQVAASAGPT